MPIKIPRDLPAFKVLSEENIFVMNDERAVSQDIRPLKIAILNLMPKKIQTENQLLRYLSNTPLQVEITLLNTESYTSQNTSVDHMKKFYSTFREIKNEKFDGLIITGAPVEKLPYEEVLYWTELKEIMEWSKSNVFSTVHICWGAQAGLYYHYNIPKYELKEKMFGVFKHVKCNRGIDLIRGLDDVFYAPHSRHTEVRREDIIKIPELEILSESEGGIHKVSIAALLNSCLILSLLNSDKSSYVVTTNNSIYAPTKIKPSFSSIHLIKSSSVASDFTAL